MQARCLGSANIRHLFISCLLEWRQLNCCVISDETDEKVLDLRELGPLGYRPVGSVELKAQEGILQQSWVFVNGYSYASLLIWKTTRLADLLAQPVL